MLRTRIEAVSDTPIYDQLRREQRRARTAAGWHRLTTAITDCNAAMRLLREARDRAGVRPGEPLLGLNLPEHEEPAARYPATPDTDKDSER